MVHLITVSKVINHQLLSVINSSLLTKSQSLSKVYIEWITVYCDIHEVFDALALIQRLIKYMFGKRQNI